MNNWPSVIQKTRAVRTGGGSYQINRNEKTWDPAFLSASFRLKEGELSAPVKSEKFGYFLIQMVERRGDDAEKEEAMMRMYALYFVCPRYRCGN
ncbi:MAG: peptidylprolyl isomerase [Bacteroidota bacterium]